MIKLIFNRTTNLNFYDLILVIKSVDTKIFGAFYCIRTLYRFSLFATITLIGIWSKFIKLALIQLSPDNIVFYLLPYGFKVIFNASNSVLIVSPIIFIFLGLLMFGSVPLIQSVCCLLSVYFFCFNLASKLFNFFSIFIHNYRVPYSK